MRGFQTWLRSLDNLWWPFHLQWVQTLRVINQLWAMRSIALMLLIVAGDVELNLGSTGSSPYSPTTTPDSSCISMSADAAQLYVLPSITGGGQFFHACPSCKKHVHIRLKICKHCGFALRRLGRSVGTTAAAGYSVFQAGGRPTGTTATAGFDVSQAGGRPTGTTAAVGFKVSSGRPVGATAATESKVGCSPWQPKGTTEAAHKVAYWRRWWPP